MVSYKKMYFTLFNHITDAIRALEAGDSGLAGKILKNAQLETEELYIRGRKQ